MYKYMNRTTHPLSILSHSPLFVPTFPIVSARRFQFVFACSYVSRTPQSSCLLCNLCTQLFQLGLHGLHRLLWRLGAD